MQDFNSRLAALPKSYLFRMGFIDWRAFRDEAEKHLLNLDQPMRFLERESFESDGHLLSVVVPEYRGRLDPSASWVDRIREDWGTPEFGEVELTPNLELEGLIEFENGKTRTQVSVGLCLALEDAILNLFSSRGFFTSRLSGDERPDAFGVLFCGDEASWRYHDYRSARQLEGVKFADGITRRVPFDPLRLSQCNLMMSLCLRWIMLHEYAHWVLGHLEWSVANGLTANAQLAEAKLFVDASTAEKTELNCCMEFQADAFATQMLFSDALSSDVLDDPVFKLHVMDRAAFADFRNAYAPSIVSRDERFRILLLASAIPSLLFDLRRENVSVANTHPPPSSRILNIFFTAMSVIGDICLTSAAMGQNDVIA